MNLITGTQKYRLVGPVMILGLAILLTACSGGVTEEDLDAVRGDLQTAQDQVRQLQAEILVVSQSAEVGFDHVSSVASLASASGSMSDLAATYDDKNLVREWLVNGNWSLNCPGACAEVQSDQIDFRMGFSMFRAEPEKMGESSHGHTFWGFESTGVKVLPGEGKESLEIKGNITGSGPISSGGITIMLEKKDNGHFTFSFKLDDGNVLTSTVGGVVLASKGS